MLPLNGCMATQSSTSCLVLLSTYTVNQIPHTCNTLTSCVSSVALWINFESLAFCMRVRKESSSKGARAESRVEEKKEELKSEWLIKMFLFYIDTYTHLHAHSIAHSHSHSHSHIYAHTHSHALSTSHSHTSYSLACAQSSSHIHTHVLSLSLCLSLSASPYPLFSLNRIPVRFT